MPPVIPPHPAIRPISETERQSWPTGSMVDLPPPFVDERGSIQPLLDLRSDSCVLIRSAKGTERANHYHRSDWHYCYVLQGRIAYYERPTGSNQQPSRLEFAAGEMFFTGPMLDHTMVFLEDTTFLTWGRNSRSQEIYEADIVRIPSLASEP